MYGTGGAHHRVEVDTYDVDGNVDGFYGISFGASQNPVTLEYEVDGFLESLGEMPEHGKEGHGTVYKDPALATAVVIEFETSKEEDKKILAHMKTLIGATAPYNALSNNCVGFSSEYYQGVVWATQWGRVKRWWADLGKKSGGGLENMGTTNPGLTAVWRL